MDDVAAATRAVLLGESIASIAAAHRQGLLDAVGLDAAESAPSTFRKESVRFAGKVWRRLAERHETDGHVEAALVEWVRQVEDYDAFDALLATFKAFDGRPALLRRGQALFPRALT